MSPFLVVGLGVDGLLIMTDGWFRIGIWGSERLINLCKRHGPPITMSSFTNIIALIVSL